MKYLKNFCSLLALALIIGACSDDPSSTGPEPPEEEVEASKKEFVYNAMNEWYLYQKDVPVLADGRFEDDEAKQEFLRGFEDANTLFDDLLVPQEVDPYSFFIEDYEEYEEEQDGIQAALGIDYGFIGFNNTQTVVGYVGYVVEGSPADSAGLQRFDLFTHVDGTELNQGNFLNLLDNEDPHELRLAEVEDTGQGLSFTAIDTVNVASEEVREDPIFRTEVIDTAGTKIGYMMYNAFQGNSHENLNNAFSDFKSEGIDELVLDLRYNGGGAVITSQLLASMISGRGSSDTFAEFSYNEKKEASNSSVPFLEQLPIRDDDGNYNDSGPITKLSLDRLYVLTTFSTASASETLINGLRPYMDVIQIGTPTEGKDVGSITLYDAPPEYSNKDNINEEHKNAIQPIVVRIINDDGDNYPEGFTPTGSRDTEGDNYINETAVPYLQSKPALGSPEEPLFARAISLITGEPMTEKAVTPNAMMQDIELMKQIKGPRSNRNIQYIEPHMMPKRSGN